jgi:hypothetical protein
LAVLRRLGYRLTTAAGDLIMISAVGRPELLRLRARADSLALVEMGEPEVAIRVSDLRQLARDRLGQPVEPWGQVEFIL